MASATARSRDAGGSGNAALFKIVRRLNPEEACNDLPGKPKRMHWKTYELLAERYGHYDAQWGREAMLREVHALRKPGTDSTMGRIPGSGDHPVCLGATRALFLVQVGA